MSAINVRTADKQYAVLELPIYDKFECNVYAVPACTAWLDNITIKINAKDGKQITFAGKCKWPPDESKLSDYLEKKKKPTDTWITYKNVKILKFCKSVRQAKEEVEKALNVSDLSQSDMDKSEKRKRFATQRYSPPLNEASCNRCKNYVNSDDSDSDFDFTAPAVRNLKISANNKNNETLQFSDEDNTENFNDDCATLTESLTTPDNCNSETEISQAFRNNCNHHSKNYVITRCDSNMNTKQTQNVPSFSKSHKSQTSDAMHVTYTSIDENVSENINPVDHTKKKYNVQKDLEINQDKAMSEHESENRTNQNSYTLIRQDTRKSYVNPYKKSPVKNNASFNERTIMAAISDLRNRIDRLHVTVMKIYTATCHPEETIDNSIGIPTLPLTSMEAFYEWEDFNFDEEKKLIMIRSFVEHGREDLKGSVYCIMRKLMTNKVAINFNLKGTNREGAKINKKKFLNTISYSLVIAALRRHSRERKDRGLHFSYNKEIADSYIATWLKDAKKRLENEEKKNKQQDEQLDNNDDE